MDELPKRIHPRLKEYDYSQFLKVVAKKPDTNQIWVVGGKPVIVQWGFIDENGTIGSSGLYPNWDTFISEIQQKPPEAETVVEEPAPAPAPAVKKDYVLYKVQFMSNEAILKPGDALLKGIEQFEYYRQGLVYRYVTGSFYKVSQAKELQDEIRKNGFKDAFVVAFYKGERISLQQAKEIVMEIGIGGEE